MRRIFFALVVAAVASELPAQLYDDLTLVRNRPSAFSEVLEARAGLLGGFPDTENPLIGLEENYGIDGYVYYRSEGFGSDAGLLEAYAGRDGAYLGLVSRDLVGSETLSRIELTTRYFPFYREGFYRSDNFVPTGLYEGTDYGASLSFGKAAGEEMLFEGGVYYRWHNFSRNDDTAGNFVIPDDFEAWGANLFMEHNTLVLDRTTGMPNEGFLLSVGVEREENNSDALFGVVGLNESTLPTRVWRGRGHLEWYFPQGESTTIDVLIDGVLADEDDRVFTYDAQRPQGHLWGDGQLGFRFDLGSGIFVRPYAQGQYLHILNETRDDTDEKFFWGGGVDLVWGFGDNLALVGYYSYLNNESRPPVSVQEDTWGEHRFFIGLEVRLLARPK